MELDDDPDEPEVEVELDSLGSFFIHLIDNDYYEDDAEASHAGDAEVIILSSGSEPLPTPKTRQANRKVRFFTPSSLFGSKLSFEETATRSSSHNPAYRPCGNFFQFTKHAGS